MQTNFVLELQINKDQFAHEGASLYSKLPMYKSPRKVQFRIARKFVQVAVHHGAVKRTSWGWTVERRYVYNLLDMSRRPLLSLKIVFESCIRLFTVILYVYN